MILQAVKYVNWEKELLFTGWKLKTIPARLISRKITQEEYSIIEAMKIEEVKTLIDNILLNPKFGICKKN